jgi:sugar O-acyltransferase (sialic acid O-acetyltransferase NeuD family)
VIVFGAAEQAEVAHFYLQRDGGCDVAAFTVDRDFIRESVFCGLPVVPFEDVQDLYGPDRYSAFVAVGYAKLNRVRAEKCAEAKRKGYRLVSYVSSRATVWPGFGCGENCFILEGNTIQPFARIANNVTIWSGNHIGHHSRIADNCFIASHVVISGGVEVGENCFIGVNATLRDHIRIGANCVIGAGSLMVKDAPENGVYSASPAELSKVPSHRLKGI